MDKDVGLSVNNVEVEEVRKIMIKPLPYDGTSDWSHYLTHFEIVATLNGWDEHEKLAWLGNSLRGEAMGTLGRLDELDKENYSSLVYYLNLTFGTDAKVYQLTLQRRVRKADESLIQLPNNIRRSVQCFYNKLWSLMLNSSGKIRQNIHRTPRNKVIKIPVKTTNERYQLSLACLYCTRANHHLTHLSQSSVWDSQVLCCWFSSCQKKHT